MRRVPKSVVVNGRKYNVIRCTQDKMPESSEDHYYGFCDPERTEILLANTLSPEQAMGTYEHEVGHASAEESGAHSIMQRYTRKHYELEEDLCRIWLPVYLAALRGKSK